MPGTDTQIPYGVEQEEGEAIDIMRWVQLLWDNRWWIVGVTAAAVIAAALYSFLATPIYSATATIYVQSSSRTPVTGFDASAAASWIDQQKFYSSQAGIILSQAVMQDAAERLKFSEDPRFKRAKEPWKILRGAISVKMIKESALFNITATGPYKDDVADWANAVAEAYRDKNLRDALAFVTRANHIMLEEARKMEEEYVKQQTLVTSTLQKQGTYFPENQKEILDKRIEALELKLNDVVVQESEVSAVVAQLRGLGDPNREPTNIPSTSTDASLQEMTKQYNEMVRDLAKLETTFTLKHPEVKALRGRILKQGRSVLGAYRNQLQALRTERANLQNELDSVKRSGLAFVGGASKGQALATSGQAIKKYMDLLYDKMKELNVSSALLKSNVNMVNPAYPPGGPVKPKKTMNLLMGLVLGLFVSVGSVVGYQFVDTSIREVEDVETRLGLNLLGMVPNMSKETSQAAVEAFQTLRTALVFASENGQKNVVMATSASPKAGKTTVVVNLARTMASTGERVLLIDCDLRRPSVARFLGKSHKDKGLTLFLANKESDIQDHILSGPHPNLYVLASGPVPPNPPELFSMKRFRDMLAEVKREYDWVLLDTPPALTISDAQILSGMVDLVVLVARFKKSKRPMTQRTLVTLSRLGANVAGAVLNDIKVKSHQYYDYYYYNHYYYETGQEPGRLPWMIRKVGGWRDLFRRRRRGGDR